MTVHLGPQIVPAAALVVAALLGLGAAVEYLWDAWHHRR